MILGLHEGDNSLNLISHPLLKASLSYWPSGGASSVHSCLFCQGFLANCFSHADYDAGCSILTASALLIIPPNRSLDFQSKFFPSEFPIGKPEEVILKA